MTVNPTRTTYLLLKDSAHERFITGSATFNAAGNQSVALTLPESSNKQLAFAIYTTDGSVIPANIAAGKLSFNAPANHQVFYIVDTQPTVATVRLAATRKLRRLRTRRALS